MPFPIVELGSGLAAVVGFLLTILLVWWRPRLESKRPVESVPMLPNSHWLFGHLFWLLGTNYLDKQRDLSTHADDRGRCSCWVGPTQPSVSLTSAEDAQRLLRNHHARHSAPILRHHFEMLAGRRNLLLLNGREWKHYQSALKSALHQQARSDPTRLQRITIERTRALVQNIQAQIGRDGSSNGSKTSIRYSSIGEFTKMITQDVFGLAALSFDFRCCDKLQLSEFAHAFEWVEDDILDRCTRNAWLPQNMCYSFPTQRNKMFLKKRKYLRSFLRDIVSDRLSGDETRPRAKRDSSGSEINTAHDNDDILEKLIEAHKAMQQTNTTDARNQSEEDLVDILLSVLLAGYDTVSIALTYAIFLISRHPRWEDLCSEEIARTNNDFDDTKDRTEVEYPLCRAVILEALRLYPVAPALSRSLEKPLQLHAGRTKDDLSMVTIPKGCHVGISVWLLHRSDKHFPKPLEFRPDRWAAFCSRTQRWIERTPHENKDNLQHLPSIPAGDTNAFLAFSTGARSCPGQSFALQEASLAFAVLIDGLKFRIDPDYQSEMEWKVIVQKPKGGVPASISIR